MKTKNDSDSEGLWGVQYDTDSIEPSIFPSLHSLAALFLFYPSDPNLVNGVSRYETSFQIQKNERVFILLNRADIAIL